MVSWSPSRCSSAERSAPGRMAGLGRLRELARIAEQDEVARRAADGDDVGQGELAGLLDDQRVERAFERLAAEQPGRPGQHLHAARAKGGFDLGVVRGVAHHRVRAPSVFGRLLHHLEPDAGALGGRAQLVEQVRDRLVAVRGDAHAPSLRARGRAPAALPCASCPEPGGPCTARHEWSSARASRTAASAGSSPAATSAPARAGAQARPAAQQQVAHRAVGPGRVDAVGGHPAADAQERVALRARLDGAAGDQRAGVRLVRIRAALEAQDPAHVVHEHDLARAEAGRRIVGLVAGADAVLLLRVEVVLVGERPVALARDAGVAEARQRLRVVVQLFERQPPPVEPHPPFGLRLAPVPADQVREELARGVRRRRPAARRDLGLGGFGRLHGRRGRGIHGGGPGQRAALRPPPPPAAPRASPAGRPATGSRRGCRPRSPRADGRRRSPASPRRRRCCPARPRPRSSAPPGRAAPAS